jgi:hypothetical protein
VRKGLQLVSMSSLLDCHTRHIESDLTPTPPGEEARGVVAAGGAADKSATVLLDSA